MKIQQLRNATLVLSLGDRRLLVDPMLSDPGAMPGFRMVGAGRRTNPLVPLPSCADEALASVTDVLVTHEHPDHLDSAGRQWIRERRLPVWASAMDVPSLVKKGLDARELSDGALGLGVEVVRSRHGRGLVGWLLGPVAGYYLAAPGEPSVYLTGDSILTDSVREAIARLRPDVVVVPAGAANFGVGGDILFSVDELIELTRTAPGQVVFNHLEALDHCPTTRAGLRQRLDDAGLGGRAHIPADGETVTFSGVSSPSGRRRGGAGAGPGVQKWLTARLSGA